MKRALWLAIGLSVFLSAEWCRNTDGIVTDYTHGLQWQDDYRDNNGSIKQGNWEEAIAYCENLTLGGYDDWRLPNINELSSLVDYDTYRPAIYDVFQHTEDNFYWSSTSYIDKIEKTWLAGYDGKKYAWVVNFYFGETEPSSYGFGYEKSKGNFYVRCVRTISLN